jgi:methionyl-tRNA formyltransferase
MRIVFMGSAELSIPSLKALLESAEHEVVEVVAQPDRPAGRKRKLTPCALKAFAVEQGLSVMTPEKVGDPASVEALAALKPDLLVVVAYGQYIPQRVIQLAPYQAINVHPSLLPKYRGSAPIQWALLNGDAVTGVSIIYLAQKMDAGDILRQETWAIEDSDTSGSLHDKLAVFGAELLLKAIDDIASDSVTRQAQYEPDVVEVRKLTKEDAPIDWSMPAAVIRNRIRAFDPWPGTTCVLPSGDLLKIWRAALESYEGDAAPGQLLDDRFLVMTGEGALRIVEVQPAGKKRMAASDFLRGHPLPAGSIVS